MALSGRSGRSRSTLVLLVLVSVTVITLDFRGGGVIASHRPRPAHARTPGQEAADAVVGPVGDAVRGVTRSGALEEENDELRARISELEGEALRGADAEAELDQVLELRGLSSFTDLPTVSARVIGTTPSNFEQSIQLDVGTGEGVAEDMPVLTGAGLAGRVVDVSRTRSIVRLVSDQTSAVGVRLPSGDLGVAEGGGPGRPLELGLVDPATVVAPGELVVTSGIDDSVFPGGIPVGRVERVAAPAQGVLEQEVVVAPVVDLDRLRYAEVLRTEPSS